MQDSDSQATWLASRARSLRREQTPQETQLWHCLRSRRLSDFKFRRQVPMGRYVVDFVCFSARLIIELDGGQHGDQQTHDQARDAWLKSQGFEVLRIWNNEWSSSREAVMAQIHDRLHRGIESAKASGH